MGGGWIVLRWFLCLLMPTDRLSCQTGAPRSCSTQPPISTLVFLVFLPADVSFRNLTRPAVLKDAGVIIEPVRFSKAMATHDEQVCGPWGWLVGGWWWLGG